MLENKTKYDANFTAGGLLLNEFTAIQPIIMTNDFDELIKVEVEENKLIGIKTRSARERIIAEIKRRHQNSSKNFWDNFYNWNVKEQKLALFYLCLKTYPLIFDIHFEVTLKKFKLGAELKDYDIQMRLDEIASVDDYVAGWSESTFRKINVQYRKVLRDAGLYKGLKLSKSSIYNPDFWKFFTDNKEQWFLDACFIKH